MPRSHQHLPRLFVNHDLGPGTTVTLDKPQAHYLVNVMRRRPGDAVILFNGRDGAWRTELVAADRKRAELEPVEQIAAQPEHPDLWYLFAPLKTGRLDYMVQKAVEMGVGHIQPVKTQHTQFPKLNKDKLAANTVEAAEQCEVLAVPELHPIIPLETLIANWAEDHPGRQIIFADESEASGSPQAVFETLAGRPLALLIGPEGGFSEEERRMLHGCEFVHPVSLGPRILRADTAAVAALGALQSIIGDWR
ncbi:16S rRNA (uracil(1498)-N(3))-methyltransferase [Cucumibacter marinus]|uniref:16S rRNA (uracil(1498)-N(3))-methyltransferase n=1 Tax=Cucumibacter marinus TaxID=1121252 RepID=UPI0004154ABC|nr:16S rRNA (uracil(1498)-N(3))-methyltransferase [Cucumibacter marinus]